MENLKSFSIRYIINIAIFASFAIVFFFLGQGAAEFVNPILAGTDIQRFVACLSAILGMLFSLYFLKERPQSF